MSEVSVMPSPRKPKKADKKPSMRTLGIRCSEEWIEWAERFADRDRRTVSALIDQAMMKYAEIMEFELPPKR